MSASVTPATIAAGGTAEVTFTLLNRSGADATFAANVCPGLLEVVDLSGRVVYSVEDLLPVVLCALDLRSATLKPGASYTWTEQWNGRARVTPGGGEFVSPGQYRVRAWIGFRFRELGAIDNRPAKIQVR